LISFVKDELKVELKAEDFAKVDTLLDIVSTIGNDKFD
jgi:acyl carrier protein